MRVMFAGLAFEQLAIGLLSSLLKREGHAVGLAFSPHLFDDRYWLGMPRLARLFESEKHVLDQIAAFRPDVLCFSALTVNYRWMLGVAAKAKELCGAKIVFGGAHPSASPELVAREPAVDFVCVGEGDVALPALLRALARGPVEKPIPNICFRRGETVVRGPVAPFYADLDRLPFFDKDLWVDHVPVASHYMTMSMRGCVYRCTFCFNNFFAELPGAAAGPYLRQRSVDHFLAELREAKRRYGIRYVHIKDDIFTVNAAWLKEFGPRYRREIGVPFFCLSHPQHLDEAKIAILKDAGCSTVQFGVESADEDYKRNELRRYENEDQVDRVMNLLAKAGMDRKVDHILALPGEDIRAQDSALRLYARYGVERIGINWFVYIPGTEIVGAAVAQGRLKASDAEALRRGHAAAFLQSRAFVDRALLKDYIAYEFVFRILPLLPRWLRLRVKQRWFRRLPAALLRAAGLAGDVLAARRLTDSRFLTFYADLYAIGLKKWLRRLFRRGASVKNHVVALEPPLFVDELGREKILPLQPLPKDPVALP